MTEAAVSSNVDVRPQFELNVSLPADRRFAETARDLAVHAAKHAGCSDARAHAFGAQVEEAIRGHVDASGGGPIPLVFRRTNGPVEVLVNGRTLTLEP
jgi:hypothetical protein